MKKTSAKDRILETASRLFHERGYSGVGINEIIDQAETAKATFYQHFRSKETLCAKWLEEIHARSEAVRREILAGTGSAADKVDRYFDGLAKFLKENDFRGCPYTNTSAVIDVECGCIRQKIESHKLSIRDFFRLLAADVAPTERRAREIGDILFVLFSGATVESQNLRSLWPVESARTAARDLCRAETTPLSD